MTYTLIYEWLGERTEREFKLMDEAMAHSTLLLKHGIGYTMLINKGE